ncbi:hypothetical protein AWB75_04904 [Caballeronia catudaia]|uniref:Uncharacterized protein n=1 Tax=Caballeronia catudaia TaxID=1777136 RepID=A0A158CC58_9BURK|nr:hypothetical protein AWB75_04904 [Caballeronia catudaia]
MSSDGDSADDSMLNSFAAAGDSDGNSLLSDAQPFEYQPSGILDQGENVAGMLTRQPKKPSANWDTI